MILTVVSALAGIAFIVTILNAFYPSRVSLWLPVLLLCLIALLQVLPLK